MPVQINEVIIRTVVNPVSIESTEGGRVAMMDEKTRCSEEEILERVFEIIQETKER
jgi:hypothetical protein